MKKRIRPEKLQEGDTVALVSLSSGMAGDAAIKWRYEVGKRRLETQFGFHVVEMPHTLAGSEYIYEHPEKRAEDLMDAFRNPDIKGIISCIGGIESIRMLPYIDLNVIRDNPKLFLGYSDSTITHMLCFKAGLSSVYGPALLSDFAENIEIPAYTSEYLQKTILSDEPPGQIFPAPEWTSQMLPWEEQNCNTKRTFQKNQGYELLQGSGNVQGRLLGGCLEVFDLLRGTDFFPAAEDFEEAILFFETSEDKPPVWFVECLLRTYGAMGILDKVNGIIWGKPMDETNYEEYKKVIKSVLKEQNKETLPVLFNVNFGHTEPKICLPYGRLAEIDCENVSLYILE